MSLAQAETDIAEACKRISKTTGKSARMMTMVCLRLERMGGKFDGGRKEFCSLFSHAQSTIIQMLETLMRKGIVSTRKEGRDGREVTGYDLDYAAIREMLSKSAPAPSLHSTGTRRGKCGHLATGLVDGVCYGCHLRDRVNRERDGMRKV